MDQRVELTILVNECLEPADIDKRPQTQYVVETFSSSMTYELCKRFKDD